LFFSKKKIISEDNCYLVEGYTDVISLHQAGIENVVASSGTSLTAEQIKLIRRYTKNITILFDGDEAGLKASFRGIDMILAEGMHVKVVLFPEGEDPDSYAKEKRPAEVKDFIQQNAKDFISFKTGLLLKEAKGDPIKKAELIKEIVKTISEIPDVVDRTVYIQECSQLMDIDERSLNSELNKLLRKKFKKKGKATTQEQEEPSKTAEAQLQLEEAGTKPHEKEIIRMLLMYANREIIFKALNEDDRPIDVPVRVAEFIVNEIVNDDLQFSDEHYAKIFKEYKDAMENEEFLPDEQYFFHHEDENIKNIAIDVTTSPYSLSDNWEEKKIYVVTEEMQLKSATVNLINAFKLRKVEALLEELSTKIKNPSKEDDMQDIITRYRDLSALKKDISEKLKRIIIK
jgi:DNA primase